MFMRRSEDSSVSKSVLNSALWRLHKKSESACRLRWKDWHKDWHTLTLFGLELEIRSPPKSFHHFHCSEYMSIIRADSSNSYTTPRSQR